MKITDKRNDRKFCSFLFSICGLSRHFVAVRKILIVKGIVPVVEGRNIINMYAVDNPNTGPEYNNLS